MRRKEKMMKKLLIFMLVLGMASVANAALVWFEIEGGGTDALPDTTITINVVADFTVGGFNVGAITANSGTVSAVGVLHEELLARTPYSHGELKDGTVNNIVLFQITGGVALNPNVAAGQVLYSFDITTGAAYTTITIDDWTGSNPFGGAPFPVVTDITGSAVDDVTTLVVDVVPEPMTVLLLGLGGLFLRRRR